VIRSDYHMHTTWSHDGRATAAEMAEAALAAGLREICLTEHLAPAPADPDHGFFRFDAYRAGVADLRAKYAGRLVIRTGIEFDYQRHYEGAVREALAGIEVDFRLGSVHAAAGLSIHRLSDAGLTEAALAGAGVDLAALQAAYFDEVEALAATGLASALGHFDYVYKQLPAVVGPRRDAGYWGRVERILALCIERGTGIEVNTQRLVEGTRGMAADVEILRRYRAMGGRRMTVGSDAHRRVAVGSGFDRAEAALREAGFTATDRYEAGRPTEVPLD
jgi:histidinol-phosphatase (PHP family)